MSAFQNRKLNRVKVVWKVKSGIRFPEVVDAYLQVHKKYSITRMLSELLRCGGYSAVDLQVILLNDRPTAYTRPSHFSTHMIGHGQLKYLQIIPVQQLSSASVLRPVVESVTLRRADRPQRSYSANYWHNYCQRVIWLQFYHIVYLNRLGPD